MLDQRDSAKRKRAALENSVAPITYLSVAEIRAHPRWHLARDTFLRIAVEGQSADSTIRQVMQDFARLVLFNLVIALHEAQGETRDSWPTVNRIREAFKPFGLASARSLDQMLARMRSIGLIELKPAPSDRRIRLVVPTERMIAEDHAWHDNNMRPLALLRPDSDDYDAVFSHDPLHRKVHRAISNGLHATAFDILDPETNPLMPFLLRQDGAKVVFLYLLEALNGSDHNRVSLSYSEAAARITTSRTHIRNLLSALEEAGYLLRHGEGGHDIELKPVLWDHAERFVASILSGNDRWWQLTRAKIAAESQSTQ